MEAMQNGESPNRIMHGGANIEQIVLACDTVRIPECQLPRLDSLCTSIDALERSFSSNDGGGCDGESLCGAEVQWYQWYHYGTVPQD